MRAWLCAAIIGGAALSPITVQAAPPAPAAVALEREKAAFYADVRAKRYDSAIVQGALAHKHDPRDDRFTLDYAYALNAAHRESQATALFEQLKTSTVPAVRTAAVRQLAAQAPAAPKGVAGGVLPPTSSSAVPPFTEAYELLAGGDLTASRDAFLAVLVTHPDDAAAWRQVSYIDFVLKDRPAMIAALDKYIALAPDDDRAKLERAYALLAEGDFPRANAVLKDLAHSSNPEVAQAASSQLAAGAGLGAGGGSHYDVFGYALNDSRFHDTFYGLDARYFLTQTKLQPYIAFHLSNDAKASSVPASDVLNDNVAIVAAGLRMKIAPVAYAFAEAGEAQSLLTGHVQTDLRVGLLLSTRLGSGGYKPQTQIDASLTHYSRYVNTIFYANVAHDFYIGSKVVRGLVGTNLALDTSRAFYNNAVEGFGGVQVRFTPFTVRLIATGGMYLGRGIDLPSTRTYSSIRPELLFGFSH